MQIKRWGESWKEAERKRRWKEAARRRRWVWFRKDEKVLSMCIGGFRKLERHFRAWKLLEGKCWLVFDPF